MTTGRGSRDIRHNLRLVLAEMWRWPKTTIASIAVLGIAIAAQFHFIEHLDPSRVVIGSVGYIVGALGMKALFMLMVNPILRKAPFQGSYLVASFITMVPIFVFYASGFYVLSVMRASHQEMNDVPTLVVAVFLLLTYPVFSLFAAGFLRLSETFQLWRLRGHNKED